MYIFLAAYPASATLAPGDKGLRVTPWLDNCSTSSLCVSVGLPLDEWLVVARGSLKCLWEGAEAGTESAFQGNEGIRMICSPEVVVSCSFINNSHEQ